MANLTTCMICGNKYDYCSNCSKTHAWKFYADTRECYQIFQVLTQLDSNVYNIKDAKQAFENIGITSESDLTTYKPLIAKKISEVVNHVDRKPERVKKDRILK